MTLEVDGMLCEGYERRRPAGYNCEQCEDVYTRSKQITPKLNIIIMTIQRVAGGESRIAGYTRHKSLVRSMWEMGKTGILILARSWNSLPMMRVGGRMWRQ